MSSKLTILNYHGVSEGAGEYRWDPAEQIYVLPVSTFEAQMEAVRARGFRTASLGELSAESNGAFETGAKSLMITFDDGHRSHLEHVAPILKEKKLGGLFFIPAGLIGTGDQMSWDQLASLVEQGFEIGAHGWNHIPLTHLSESELWEEFIRPKQVLEEKLGIVCRSFSIPRGFFRPRFSEVARRAGYEFLFTSQFDLNGPSRNPLALKRIVIKAGTTEAYFHNILSGNLGLKRYIELAKEGARRSFPPAFYDSLMKLKQAAVRR